MSADLSNLTEVHGDFNVPHADNIQLPSFIKGKSLYADDATTLNITNARSIGILIAPNVETLLVHPELQVLSVNCSAYIDLSDIFTISEP